MQILARLMCRFMREIAAKAARCIRAASVRMYTCHRSRFGAHLGAFGWDSFRPLCSSWSWFWGPCVTSGLSEELLGGPGGGPWGPSVRLGFPGGDQSPLRRAKGRPQGAQKRSGGASGTLPYTLKNIEKPLIFVVFWGLGASLEGTRASSGSSKGRPWGAMRSV